MPRYRVLCGTARRHNHVSAEIRINGEFFTITGAALSIGRHGETVPSEIIHTEDFLRDTMGWDFTNVWQWDANLELPILQVFCGNTQQWTVTFTLAGGTRTDGGELIQTIVNGNDAIAPIVERDGFFFAGWDGVFTNVTSDRTITAQWTEIPPDEWTVTFALAGGTRTGGGELIQTIINGNAAIVPIVERDGFFFAGWDGVFTNVTNDRTITAQWTEIPPDEWTVTFALAGGTLTGGSELIQTIVNVGDATAPIVERDGFFFAGWDGVFTNVTNDLTITAQWMEIPPDSHLISFVLNGGAFINPDSATRIIEPGEDIGILPRATPLIFTREGGYRFTGWFEDTGDENTRWRDFYEVTGDVTLYARWTLPPNPSDFLLGDADGNGRITSADATSIARWLVTPEDNRATALLNFCQLTADIDGDGEVTIDDITLLARWLVGHNVGRLLARCP